MIVFFVGVDAAALRRCETIFDPGAIDAYWEDYPFSPHRTPVRSAVPDGSMRRPS
jgi:hypothetical protein